MERTMSDDKEKPAPGHKQTFYFPLEMLDEMKTQAARLNQPLSRLVQIAWRRARKTIREEK
jgi:uncharacterized small protein (TIGR04563 family)